LEQEGLLMRRFVWALLPYLLIGLLFAGILGLTSLSAQNTAAGQSEIQYALKNGRPATEGSE
jgi:hypothetical protein